MRNLSQKLHIVIASLTTQITLDSYRRLLYDNKIDKEICTQLIKSNKELDTTIRKSNEIIRELEPKIIFNQNNVDDKLKSIEDGLNNLKETATNISNNVKISNNDILEYDKDVIINNSNIITQINNKTSKIIDELLEILINSGSGSSNNNQFINNNIINDIYLYLSSLNIIQISIISHILVSVCLLYCIFNILLVFFGDKLIIYYNLENKYIKLAKFIQLRRQFQQYYILINCIFVIMVVLYLSYLDILLLYKIS